MIALAILTGVIAAVCLVSFQTWLDRRQDRRDTRPLSASNGGDS